jgi:hypothetical protein
MDRRRCRRETRTPDLYRVKVIDGLSTARAGSLAHVPGVQFRLIIGANVLRKTLPLTLLATMTLMGCDQLSQSQRATTPTPTPKSKVNRFAAHRFVLTKFNGGVAFDTQTGQICRTWDWSLTGKPAKPDSSSGIVPQREYGELAPTCLSLYQQYPSGADSGTDVVLDDSGSN